MLRRTSRSLLAGNYAKNYHAGMHASGGPNQSYLVAASLGAIFGIGALYRLNHDRSRGAKLLEAEADVPAELYATTADPEPSPFMDRQRYYADPLEAPSAVSRLNAELAARDTSSKRIITVSDAITNVIPGTKQGTISSGGGGAPIPTGSGGMIGSDAQARFWDRWFDKEGNAAAEVPAAQSDTGFLGTLKAALFANAHDAAERAKEFEQKGDTAVVTERVAGAAAAVKREEATLAKRTREAAAAAEKDVTGYLGKKMETVQSSGQLESVSHQTEAKEDQGWQGIATVSPDVKRSTGRPITEAERGPIVPAAAHTGFFGWVSDKAENLKEAVVGSADEAKAAAETATREARREAGEAGRDVRTAAADVRLAAANAAAEADAAARNAEANARGVLGSIKDKIVGTVHDAEKATANALDDAKTSAANAQRNLAARADNAEHEARGFFGSIKDKIVGTAHEAEGAARDTAKDLANTADRAKRDINTAAHDAEHEARGIFSSLKDKIVGAAHDVEKAAERGQKNE